MEEEEFRDPRANLADLCEEYAWEEKLLLKSRKREREVEELDEQEDEVWEEENIAKSDSLGQDRFSVSERKHCAYLIRQDLKSSEDLFATYLLFSLPRER